MLRETGRTPEYPPPSVAWLKVAEKHRNQSVLDDEAIYSLPTSLIDSIASRIPGFLTQEEEQFERALSAAAPYGFFQQQPFCYPPLTHPSQESSQLTSMDKKVAESNEQIRQMLADDMMRRGIPPLLIEEDERRSETERRLVEEFRWGYAGWLATSAEFKRQRDVIRAASTDGQPSQINLTFTGYSGMPPTKEALVAHHLLVSWGVECFSTWDLPIPLRPELHTPSLYDVRSIADAGVTVFIPWYLLRCRSFDVYALFDALQRQQMQSRLFDWQSDTKMGPNRYVRMLRLYVYLELALRRRYGKGLRRKLIKFDKVFGEYFAELGDAANEESIRRLRLEMKKRLHPVDAKT